MNNKIEITSTFILVFAWIMSDEVFQSLYMMLYKNTKAMVHSPNGVTDFFDIVVGVLQEDTLAPYLFIICQQMSIDLRKENGLTLKQEADDIL